MDVNRKVMKAFKVKKHIQSKVHSIKPEEDYEDPKGEERCLHTSSHF